MSYEDEDSGMFSKSKSKNTVQKGKKDMKRKAKE
jgi:hypothetical protein